MLGTLSRKVEVPSARSFPHHDMETKQITVSDKLQLSADEGEIFSQPSGFIICLGHLPEHPEITLLPWTVSGICPALSVHACGLQFLLLLLCLNFGGCHS